MKNLTISCLSDLHLDIGNNHSIKLPDSDILCLAGDIVEARWLRDKMNDSFSRGLKKRVFKLFEKVAEKYEDVYAISGNHEPYDMDICEAHDVMREVYNRFNITYLDGEDVVKNDYSIFGATWWTDFGGLQIAEDWAAESMNDYAMIFYGGRNLNTLDVIRANKVTTDNIAEFLSGDDSKPRIVLTHHAPSSRSVHPRFVNDIIGNLSYHNNADDLASKADLWMHGHMHNVSFYDIGQCAVICNPYGYQGLETRGGFYNEDIVIAFNDLQRFRGVI